MPLRKYRFRWVDDFSNGHATARVVCAEDAKDAIIMFEHERRNDGIPKHYAIAAIAPDACPTCLGFPHEQAEKCWQCKGTGIMPPAVMPRVMPVPGAGEVR
jgi:hypothetical protein